MTPKEKVEALLRKTVAAGCPVGEVIAANEAAVKLAIKYRIPSNQLLWPALPAGYKWEGQNIIPVVAPAPKPEPTPHQRHQARNAQAHAYTAAAQPTGARVGSKAHLALQLISRPGGATIDSLVQATGWQPHSVRGWVSIQNRNRRASGQPPIKSGRSKGGNTTYSL